MADSLPVTIQMGALPPNSKWTPQQLAEAMVQRMRLVTAQTFALFVTGSTEPSSNVGPWLKNGTEWWVWSDSEGAYVAISIPASSLGYYIGSSSPDQNIYSFWIETTVGGSPLALKIYYGGAWVDVYATTLAAYAPLASPGLTGTPTTPTAAPGTNTTQIASTAFVTAAQAVTLAAANAYTDAEIAGIPAAMNTVPGVGRLNVAQSIPADGTQTVMTIDSAPINSDGAIVIADNAYVAPATGTYHFDVFTQFQNDTATASGVEVNVQLFVNGVGTDKQDLDGTPSPNGGRWSPGFGALVSLNAGDKVTCVATVNDGVGTGAVDLTTWELAGYRVK